MYKVVKNNLDVTLAKLSEVVRVTGIKQSKLYYHFNKKKLAQYSSKGYVITKLS